jgi:hypothetical protein
VLHALLACTLLWCHVDPIESNEVGELDSQLVICDDIDGRLVAHLTQLSGVVLNPELHIVLLMPLLALPSKSGCVLVYEYSSLEYNLLRLRLANILQVALLNTQLRYGLILLIQSLRLLSILCHNRLPTNLRLQILPR